MDTDGLMRCASLEDTKPRGLGAGGTVDRGRSQTIPSGTCLALLSRQAFGSVSPRASRTTPPRWERACPRLPRGRPIRPSPAAPMTTRRDARTQPAPRKARRGRLGATAGIPSRRVRASRRREGKEEDRPLEGGRTAAAATAGPCRRRPLARWCPSPAAGPPLLLLRWLQWLPTPRLPGDSCLAAAAAAAGTRSPSGAGLPPWTSPWRC